MSYSHCALPKMIWERATSSKTEQTASLVYIKMGILVIIEKWKKIDLFATQYPTLFMMQQDLSRLRVGWAVEK